MPLEQRKEADPGFEICDECSGYGFVKSNNYMGYEFCSECKGEGQIDWIQNIVGKPENKLLVIDNPCRSQPIGPKHGDIYKDHLNQTFHKYDEDKQGWVTIPWTESAK